MNENKVRKMIDRLKHEIADLKTKYDDADAVSKVMYDAAGREARHAQLRADKLQADLRQATTVADGLRDEHALNAQLRREIEERDAKIAALKADVAKVNEDVDLKDLRRRLASKTETIKAMEKMAQQQAQDLVKLNKEIQRLDDIFDNLDG